MWDCGCARLDFLPAAIEFGDLLRFRDDGNAIERRQLGDQLRHGHAKFGRAGLKHAGGPLVDLDFDVRAHAQRIP